MRIYYCIASLLLVLTSCEPKELPENTGNDEVVFYALGTLDGGEFFLQAGPNDIVVESDAMLIEGELPFFTTEFFNIDCKNCDESLEITFIGDVPFEDGLEIEELLPMDNYSLAGEIDNPIGISEYYVESNATEFSIIDEFGSQVFETDEGLVTLNEGYYEYILNMDIGLFGCAGEVAGSFYIDETGEVCLSQVEFGEDDEGEYLDFSQFASPIINIFINGDNYTLTGDNDIIYVDDIIAEFGEIFSLSVVNFWGEEPCSEITNMTYTFFNGFESENCIPELFIEQQFEFDEPEPMTVIIRYTDEEGNEYVTLEDIDGDEFTLVNLEEYGEDPFGREAFRSLVQFSVSLTNIESGGNMINLDITEAFIPVVLE